LGIPILLIWILNNSWSRRLKSNACFKLFYHLSCIYALLQLALLLRSMAVVGNLL
jgi:hypothetical protein